MRAVLVVFLLILVLFEILILFPKQTDKAPATQAEAKATSGEGKTNGTPNAPAKKEIRQEMRGEGVHIVESQKGARDWELFAQAAQSFQGQSEWDLAQVRILFYNNELQDMVVRGAKGQILTEGRDMRIEGNVEIETSNGYVFLAPYIEYKSKLRLIECAGEVQVKGPIERGKRSLFMKATGMRIPVTERKMYLDRNVTGQRLLQDDKVLTFKSGSAELSATTNTAMFKTNVVISYPPMVMHSQNAVFAYDEKTKLFDYLELQGHVELKEANRRAVSENLRVDFSTKQFTFSGQPRLYQGEDELVGDQIIFMDNGKRVKVENVKARGTLDE